MRRTFFIPKSDKWQAKQIYPQRFIGKDFFTAGNWIPEIDVHD
jgi:hypothetical protein